MIQICKKFRMETTEAPSVGLFGRHKSQDVIDSSKFIENDQDGV